MIYNTSISILSKYFNKYKRIAAGISVCGAGVGSFVLPIVIKTLEDAYGWRGALFMMGGIYAQNIILASLYKPVSNDIKHEQTFCKAIKGDVNRDASQAVADGEHTQFLSERPSSTKKDKDYPDPSKKPSIKLANKNSNSQLKKAITLFKSPSFLCVCLHTTVLFFSIIAIYTHYGSYVLSIGFTRSDVALLYMAVGIATTITRVLLGIVTEVTNANSLIIMMASSLIAGGLTIALPFTDNIVLLYIYAVSFGALISPWNTLCLPVTMDLVPQSQVATAFGVICLFAVPGLVFGAPLAGNYLSW